MQIYISESACNNLYEYYWHSDPYIYIFCNKSRSQNIIVNLDMIAPTFGFCHARYNIRNVEIRDFQIYHVKAFVNH